MTVQEPDIIFYHNEKLELEGYPLITYFELHPPMPSFQMRRTSNHRGYVATWEVIDNRIYLKQIDGNLEGDAKFTLKDQFPNATNHVFADWISHPLYIRKGKLLGIRPPFTEVFEESLILTVKNGIVVDSKIKKNKI